MTPSLFTETPLQERIAALRQDLVHPDGPRISTMRNYRFAILVYDPREEFELRRRIQDLSRELVDGGWFVLPIDLQRLFHARLRAQGQEWLDRLVEMERRLHGQSENRALNHLRHKLSPLLEGPELLANLSAQPALLWPDPSDAANSTHGITGGHA